MLERLTRADRMHLLRFVCSFAWADLEVGPTERAFVKGLFEELGLDSAEERRQVATWLRVPPRPEEVDPTQVPKEHRALFVSAARAIIERDGRVSQDEAEMLSVFEQLLRDDR